MDEALRAVRGLRELCAGKCADRFTDIRLGPSTMDVSARLAAKLLNAEGISWATRRIEALRVFPERAAKELEAS
ncbi:MAG: hypothetical protein WCQ50_16285 [Spirochaetota bacterium]